SFVYFFCALSCLVTRRLQKKCNIYRVLITSTPWRGIFGSPEGGKQGSGQKLQYLVIGDNRALDPRSMVASMGTTVRIFVFMKKKVFIGMHLRFLQIGKTKRFLSSSKGR